MHSDDTQDQTGDGTSGQLNSGIFDIEHVKREVAGSISIIDREIAKMQHSRDLINRNIKALREKRDGLTRFLRATEPRKRKGTA